MIIPINTKTTAIAKENNADKIIVMIPHNILFAIHTAK